MSIPVISFFNNKGGMGATSLVYHLAWMLSDLGVRVLAADLDPQANLTSMYLTDSEIESLFDSSESTRTIFSILKPLVDRSGDFIASEALTIQNGPYLIPGDLTLSTFEDTLSSTWPDCLPGNIGAFRVTSAFWKLMQQTAEVAEAGVILADLGPNLGAINRSALTASDYVSIEK